MLKKALSMGACSAVGLFYFGAQFFVADTDIEVFSIDGRPHVISMTDHPDGTMYVTLYDDDFDALATTEWFRPKGEPVVRCERPDDCVILTRHLDDGSAEGWRLDIDPRAVAPLTNAQWESERTHGFVPHEEPPKMAAAPARDGERGLR